MWFICIRLRWFRKTRLWKFSSGWRYILGVEMVVRGIGRVSRRFSFNAMCELTDSFYITCKTLHEKQQTLQNRFLDDCITSSSSSIGTLLSQRWIIASSFRVEHRLRAAASNSSSTLYIYIERETPATFALFAYIIIIVSSKTRAALRRWTSTRPSRRRLAL